MLTKKMYPPNMILAQQIRQSWKSHLENNCPPVRQRHQHFTMKYIPT